MTNLNRGNGWRHSSKHNKFVLMAWLRNLCWAFPFLVLSNVLRIHTSTVDTCDCRNLESAKSKEMELQLSADWLTTVDMPLFSPFLSLSRFYTFFLFNFARFSLARLILFENFAFFSLSLSLGLLLLLIRTGAVGKINKRNNTWAKQIHCSFNDVNKREKRTRKATRSLQISRRPSGLWLISVRKEHLGALAMIEHLSSSLISRRAGRQYKYDGQIIGSCSRCVCRSLNLHWEWSVFLRLERSSAEQIERICRVSVGLWRMKCFFIFCWQED